MKSQINFIENIPTKGIVRNGGVFFIQKRGYYGRAENDLLSEMWKKNRHLGWAVNYESRTPMQEMQETSHISC